MLTYLFFFLGIILLGDIMLIPLIYFAVTHTLSLPSVIFVGILAKTAADCMWYGIGRSFNKEKLYSFFRLKFFQEKSPELFNAFNKGADKILFLSNFLHGLRVPVRILYGLERHPFKSFLAINIFGSFLWLILIAGLAFTLDVSAEELKIYVRRGEIVLLALFILFFVFEFWVKQYVKRFLSNTSSSENSEESNPQGN
jgi:membrane protein DedA with SNARE-associated domain